MSSWRKGGAQTDCVSARTRGWSETKTSWPCWKCEGKGERLLPPSLPPPPLRRQSSPCLAQGWLHILCLYSVPQTPQGPLLLLFYERHVQGKSCLCTACSRSFPLAVSVDRREAGLDRRRAEASHHWAGEHVRRAGAALRLHPHLLRFRYRRAKRGRIIYLFRCYLHTSITGAQLLGNASGI